MSIRGLSILGFGVCVSFNFRKLARDLRKAVAISRSLTVFEIHGVSFIVFGLIFLNPAVDWTVRFNVFRHIDFSTGVEGGSNSIIY